MYVIRGSHGDARYGGSLRGAIAAARLGSAGDGRDREVLSEDRELLARAVRGEDELTPEGWAELTRHAGSLPRMVWAGGEAFFGSGD